MGEDAATSAIRWLVASNARTAREARK